MSNYEPKKFVRKHPSPGVYGIKYKRRHIEIKDRQIFITGDEGLKKIFADDPEIIEFQPEPYDQDPKGYKDMTSEALKNTLQERHLKVPSTDLEAISSLKKYDEENSKAKNDQGEQAPE